MQGFNILMNAHILIMRSISLKKSGRQQNQFLESPRTSRHNIKQKQRLSQDIKAKYIEQLEQRNRKLKYEIIKINEMLEEQKDKPATLKKEHKLIPIDSSADVIKKELENAYKQIKNYEREIAQLQAKQAGGMITDRMSRLENIYKQKSQHLDKLKSQLAVLTKSSLDNSKKLKNNAGKEVLENNMLKYNEEIKVMREKMRDYENKQRIKIQNAKKQLKYIANLQNELIQNNVPSEQLEQMKRNNIFIQIYNKIDNKNGDKDRDRSPGYKSKGPDKQEIEDMTLDRYKELQNQAKLHQKLQADYERRLENMEKEKINEEKESIIAKVRLDDKQEEIVRLQQEINELKTKIKKTSIKPISNIKQAPQQQKPKQKPKVTPTLKAKNPSIPTKSITDQTHIKYDQKGQVTEKGRRFTDRTMLGKTTDTKIIGIRIWTQKNNFTINGIQCTYKIGDTIRPGPQHINKQAKSQCVENVMELADGDYIKAISGHLSQNNIIEYLVFISKNSIVGRMGVAKNTQKQFNFDIDDQEIPVCMYGSIVNNKDGKVQGSVIENLGFQITRDKAVTYEV